MMSRIIHSPLFERAIPIIVGVAAFAYAALAVDRFHSDTIMLGLRPVGVPKSEILYGFGRPEAVRSDQTGWLATSSSTPINNYDLWRFKSDGGGTFLIHFDGTGSVDEVTCFHPRGDPGTCPGAFWINLGDTEDRVAYELGRPPVRILDGTSAVIRYPSIGVDFELQQFKVRRITVRTPKSPIFARIPRFIRFAIP
jgi:hypothetical protein